MRGSEARAREIGVLDENKRRPNEGVMEQPQGCAITDERGMRNNGRERNYEELLRVYVSRAIFQRKLELIHGVELVHVANDILHFAFAMDFPRDVFERIHDLRIHPLVHIFDDFVVVIVMRVHIQRLLRFRGELFLALGDGDDVAVIFVFEGVSATFVVFSGSETFNHPELVTENILDGHERENEEYA